MDNTGKQREAIADARGEVEIEMVPNGPGQWILKLVGPAGLQIRPGDTVWIDNTFLDELKGRIPSGTPVPSSEIDAADTAPATEPEDSGGDDYASLERELKEIADLLRSNNGEKAERR